MCRKARTCESDSPISSCSTLSIILWSKSIDDLHLLMRFCNGTIQIIQLHFKGLYENDEKWDIENGYKDKKASSDKCLVLCRSLAKYWLKSDMFLAVNKRLSSHDAAAKAQVRNFTGIELGNIVKSFILPTALRKIMEIK